MNSIFSVAVSFVLALNSEDATGSFDHRIGVVEAKGGNQPLEKPDEPGFL